MKSPERFLKTFKQNCPYHSLPPDRDLYRAITDVERLRRPSQLGKAQFLNYLAIDFLEAIGDVDPPPQAWIDFTQKLLQHYLDKKILVSVPVTEERIFLRTNPDCRVLAWHF